MTFNNSGIVHAGHGDIKNWGAVGQGATVNNDANRKHGHDGVDVAVLTALSKELAAVVRVLSRSPSYECVVGEGERLVHRAEVAAGDAPLRVVATMSTSIGNRSAGSGYEFLRQQFAPSVVVMLGIAGAIRGDLRIGDVVIGDEVVYYDLRKRAPGGVLRRGSSHPVPATARNMINAFLTAAGGNPAELTAEDGTFRVYAGPIGSGEAVIAEDDSPVREFLTGFNERMLALEMESAGVAHAHFETASQDPLVRAWLPIRGISDLANAAKNYDHQAAAAQHAAIVFERMLPFLRVTG